MRWTLAAFLLIVSIPAALTVRGRASSPPACGLQEEVPPVERGNLKTLVEGCRKCHEDVYDEWEVTQHKNSWTDPVFMAMIKDAPDQGRSCARCHAPQEVLSSGVGKIPLARTKDLELGVNCVTCHMRGNTYHGPFESTGHGGVEAESLYREAGLCLSCHGQKEVRAEHDQGTSFLAGPAPAQGKTCQSCHMPEAERKLVTSPTIKEKYTIGVQKCRTHKFTGARRGEIVKGAAELAITFEGENAVVRIALLTGHGLPATSDRDVLLAVTFLAEGGRELGKAERHWQFPAGPVLDPGKPETIVLSMPASTVTVRAALAQTLLKTEGRDADVIQPINEAEAQRTRR